MGCGNSTEVTSTPARRDEAQPLRGSSAVWSARRSSAASVAVLGTPAHTTGCSTTTTTTTTMDYVPRHAATRRISAGSNYEAMEAANSAARPRPRASSWDNTPTTTTVTESPKSILRRHHSDTTHNRRSFFSFAFRRVELRSRRSSAVAPERRKSVKFSRPQKRADGDTGEDGGGVTDEEAEAKEGSLIISYHSPQDTHYQPDEATTAALRKNPFALL